MDHAALAEPLACCLNGMERVFFKAGKSVLVIGAGAIGLLLVQLARAYGSPLIILYDIDPKRLKNAYISQPDYVINNKANLMRNVQEITAGHGVDIVFVACASPEAQEESLKVVAKRGAVNFFGGLPSNARNINISSNYIHYREIYLTGSHGSTPAHHASALKLIATKKVDVSNLITHRYSLDDIKKAFETVKKRLGLKVIIHP
jgi:L-iditol 2-dehydrogenase